MQIIHKVDSFLYSLFNIKEGEINDLFLSITRYYTVNEIEPTVKNEDNLISVLLDLNKSHLKGNKYDKLISLCESRKFVEAYPLAIELCTEYNTNSDLFRIKGQIESELNESDKAIDSLIDALRWNPKNIYALIMMGNIFARDKDDVDTAMKYFNQASIIDPNDHISLNNIGANLLALKKIEEAEEYFRKANAINSNYPNTQYALGRIEFIKGNFNEAFEFVLKSVQLNKSRDVLYQNSISLINEISEKIINSQTAQNILAEFTKHIEKISGKEVRIEIDDTIPTAAKVEFAENYGRDYHFIKYKSGYPGVLHLILHELTHLELASEARIVSRNEVFTSTNDHRINFISHYEGYCKFLQKKDILSNL